MFYTILIVIGCIVLSGIRTVKEYERSVIFFLGKFKEVRGPGLIYIIPIFERSMKVPLRTITMNIPSQKIITKDNVSIDIAAVAYYHVVDPKNAVIAVENVYDADSQDRPPAQPWKN